jgi:hypothetical protein
MIQPPHRSVTRFFIPLIDVLILLFCIFLLMPIIEQGGTGGEDRLTPGQVRQLREQLDRVTAELNELRRTRGRPERIKELEEQIKELKQLAQRSPGDRIFIRTFQIDPKTGDLVYYTPDRVAVRNQEEARLLIARDQQIAGKEKRELLYLILYPRDPSSLHPTREERARYEHWFRDQGITLGWDIPREDLGGKGG